MASRTYVWTDKANGRKEMGMAVEEVGRSPSGRAAGLRPQPASQSSQSSIPSAGNPIVGHATFCDDDGNRWHEPLRKSDAEEIWASVEREAAERVALMPTEEDCLKMLGRISQRFSDFGWRPAIYCPKDGRTFDVIEFGSTGIHTCHYEGKWPTGSWWIHDGGDLWPPRS